MIDCVRVRARSLSHLAGFAPRFEDIQRRYTTGRVLSADPRVRRPCSLTGSLATRSTSRRHRGSRSTDPSTGHEASSGRPVDHRFSHRLIDCWSRKPEEESACKWRPPTADPGRDHPSYDVRFLEYGDQWDPFKESRRGATERITESFQEELARWQGQVEQHARRVASEDSGESLSSTSTSVG